MLGSLVERAIEESINALTSLKHTIYNYNVRIEEFIYSEDGAAQPAANGLDELIAPCTPPEDSVVLVGIDSSSRGIDSTHGTIALAALSAVIGAVTPALDYPPVSGRSLVSPPRDVPYIAVAPDNEEGMCYRRLHPCIRCRSPAGHPYDRYYNRSQIMDELRTSLETFGLSVAPQLAAVAREVSGAEEAVCLVDGPIYHTPSLVREERDDVEKYVEAWASMIRSRLAVLREVGGLVAVAGIVKRVERSRLLVRCGEFAAMVHSRLGVEIAKLGNDLSAVDYLARVAYQRLPSDHPMMPIRIGPFVARPESLGLGRLVKGAPPKYFVYIAAPRHPYHYGWIDVFRVEAVGQLGERIEELASLVAASSLGIGVPAPIAAADRRCREVARSLFLYAYRAARGRLTLTRETEIEFLTAVSGGGAA